MPGVLPEDLRRCMAGRGALQLCSDYADDRDADDIDMEDPAPPGWGP